MIRSIEDLRPAMEKTQQKTTWVNTNNEPTLYWHDYETFGLSPGADRPSQFAGIRTDLDLNIISEANQWFCRIPRDYLPEPEACLITGITPQQTLQYGIAENEFIDNINQEFSKQNSCVVGYNNIRFDDEVTRFTLYRNFADPYQREWKNGNSRWDIIDLVRACYALRPDGINWPLDNNDVPSFRLELLSKANSLAHDQAHDAMSDVYATIAIAKLIKEKQPKLYAYYFNLRNKKQVLDTLKVGSFSPLIHVSGMFPALQGCISYILPICMHPTNKNAVIVVDLAKDLTNLQTLSIEQIREYMYSKTIDLPAGITRPALKLIHLNKCPFVSPAKTLSQSRADELGINRIQCRKSLNFIKENSTLVDKLYAVYNEARTPSKEQCVEEMLYQSFFGQEDKKWIEEVKKSSWQTLTSKTFNFHDPRLKTLLWHYRARNAPDALNEDEQQKWALECQASVFDKTEQYINKIDALAIEHQNDKHKIEILHKLHHYLQFLTAN